jgi:ABC-2 type transport system ATP-binding protein
MTNGIVVENLVKEYRNTKRQSWFRRTHEYKRAVDGLNMVLPAGRITGLLGLNGAGKTTTIKVLSTLLLPSAGRITVDGLDIVRDATTLRHQINMIAGGERMVYWRLTGRENLWYFAQLYDVDRQIVRQRVQDLLQLVGLQDAADTPVERYSKGMKQRLQIARGLINDPKYLLMDEPTLGLDAPIARELRQMVRKLAADGKVVLLTSHYLAEVDELCNHVYVIDQGRLVAAGSPAELKTRTRASRTVRVQLANLPSELEGAVRRLADELEADLDVREADDTVMVIFRHPHDISGRVAAEVALGGGALLKLEALEPTLEDAVLALAAETRIRQGAAHAA